MIINKVLKNIKINIFFKLVFLVSVLVIFSDTFLVKAEGGCKDPAVCTCTEVTTCTCPVNPPTNPDPDPDPDPDPPKPPRIPPCLKPPCIVPEGDEGDVGYDQSEPNFSFLALVKNSIPKISNNIGGSGNSNVLGQASCDSCDSVPCSTDTTTCKSSGRECIRTGDNSFSCWWWTCSGNCYGGGCGPDNPSPPVTPPPSSGNSPGGVHDDSYCDNDGKIVSSGWACDADDYETPLEVRTYTGGTLIASGTANIPAEEAVGNRCGGKRDHRFYIKTQNSFPTGTYKIYAYGVNIGSTGGDKLLSGSPKTITCTATNNSPGGNFDGISCTNGKIKVSGWACDGDDYTQAVRVHAYVGGKYGEGGTIAGNFVADSYRADDPWPVCGGNRNHGFKDVELSGTYTGKQTVYLYGINIGPTGGNTVLSGSPKEVDCGVGYTRIEGIIWDGSGINWPGIGESWKGDSSLTCSGVTKYHPNFQITTNRATGNQITNWWCHNSLRQAYYATDYNIEKTGNLNATLSGLPANYIVDKWIYKTYTRMNETSGTFPAGTVTYKTKDVTLTPLDAWINFHWKLIDCSDTSWEEVPGSCSTMCGPGEVKFECRFPDPRCPGTPDCSSIPKPSTPCNMDNPCVYNLKTTVKKIPTGSTVKDNCSSLMSGAPALEGATVTVRDKTMPIPTVSFPGADAKSNSQGIALINNIPYGVTNLLISGYLTTGGDDTPETYTTVCPASVQYTFPTPPDFLPYPKGGTIPTGGDYPTVETSMGLQAVYKSGWLSVIDADMFSLGLDVNIPLGRTNNSDPSQTPKGFAKVLLNTVHPDPKIKDELMLGYVFVEDSGVFRPDVDAPIPNTKLSEVSHHSTDPYQYGGIAYNLREKGFDHRSKWLENFTFKAPSSAKEIPSLPLELEGGTVHTIKKSVVVGSSGHQYTIKDENKGPVIIYIEGNLSIQGPITTNSNQRVLFVVSESVDISSSVGTLADSFNMSQNPNIMAGIVARDRINIHKRADRDLVGGLVDIPIMLSAPLISKTHISFQRDLGHDNNAIMPGQSVKQYNKFLYEISKLEREKGFDNLYYTGLTTFDLDWEYIY